MMREVFSSRDRGNDVHYGTGLFRRRMEQMHHESSSLSIDMIDNAQFLDQNIDSCHWAAGNYSLTNKPDYILSNDYKSNKSNLDYEKMLFETHGCTIYHHQQQLDNDNIQF